MSGACVPCLVAKCRLTDLHTLLLARGQHKVGIPEIYLPLYMPKISKLIPESFNFHNLKCFLNQSCYLVAINLANINCIDFDPQQFRSRLAVSEKGWYIPRYKPV